jgi:N-acetylmuramoyl-L-alanine amidase
VLRVSLHLEREVPFTTERLDGPARVLIDLGETSPSDTSRERTLSYADDVVQQIRVGPHAGSRTRVVLDLRRGLKPSVYALYDPYRVVVDFERAAAPKARVAAARVVPVIQARSARLVLLPAPALARPVAIAAGASGSTNPSTTPQQAAAPAAVPVPSSQATPLPPSANRAGGFSLSRQLGLGVTRIAIDPGHGGHDPGAKVKGLTEADLVLNVALRLEKLLAKQPGIEVLLTRKENTYVPLEERTAIANRAGADMFLSIHANASANTTTQGIETYFLNFASSDAAEAVAARENSASGRSMRDLPEIVKAIARATRWTSRATSPRWCRPRSTSGWARGIGRSATSA